MEELVLLLKELFSKSQKFYTFFEIQKTLNIKGEERLNILEEALEFMTENGSIFYDSKFGYKLFPKDEGYAFGTIYINKAGTGFVTTDDGYTILIENSNLNGALDGDAVIVSNIFKNKREYFFGEIYKVT